jgi:Tfp pilus assembly protein PilN
MRAVNLIPVEQRGGAGPAAGRSEGGAYAVLVLLAGLAVLALVYGMARHQISSRQGHIAALMNEAQQAQAKASQLAPYASFLTMREQRVQAVSQLAESRFDWAHAFHELGRVLPASVSISSLTGSVGGSGSSPSGGSGRGAASVGSGGTVTSATPPGSVPTFTLSGCAKSQLDVAETLVRLRLINGVSSVELQSSSKPASGSGGSCPGAGPTFTLQINFDPLPTPPATGAATTNATTGAAATASGASRTRPTASTVGGG